MAATVAARNKKVRQDALREQISKRCTVQQVLKNIEKMEEQGAAMESTELQALRAATDTRLKLLNKYIPDLKQSDIELTGADGGPIQTDSVFEFIPVGSND